MLRLKPFTEPTRPAAVNTFGARKWCVRLLAVAAVAYVSGSWWVLCVGAYAFLNDATQAYTESLWNRYADQCETTFREIGQSADSLAKTLQAIAEKIEADARVQEMVVTVDEPETVTVETHVSTTHDVRYWVSESKGSN